MDFAQMEPYRTANDQVNHSCGILIDEGTSGAPSSRFREQRQSLLRVRSFRVDTASRPVEIGALLALSRGQTTSQLCFHSLLCFFLETRARYPSGISAIRQRAPRRVRDGTPLGMGRENTPGCWRGERDAPCSQRPSSQYRSAPHRVRPSP